MNEIKEKFKVFDEWTSYLKNYEDEQYKETVVGIVDILGFSSFVIKDELAPKKIIKIISTSMMINNSSFPQNIKYKMLSDTLIVYCDEPTENNIFRIICALENFRLILLEEGFLCRGAIVIGKNYINTDILVSQAFINAYKIEEEVCNYPRIIVSSEVMEVIKPAIINNIQEKSNNIFIRDLVIKDNVDNEYIVAPFIGIPEIATFIFKDYNYYANKMKYTKIMNKYKKGLMKCIETSVCDRKIKQKINYFIEYYNSILEKSTKLNMDKSDLFLQKLDM